MQNIIPQFLKAHLLTTNILLTLKLVTLDFLNTVRRASDAAHS